MPLPLSQLSSFGPGKSVKDKDEKHDESCGVCGDFKSIRRTRFDSSSNVADKLRNAVSHNSMDQEEKERRDADPYQPFDCPADSAELGNSTWTFLHTMAAYYPEKASDEDKKTMNGLIDGLGKFYPCNECATHLRKEIKTNPPFLEGSKELSKWFCNVHNEVNIRQGKPTFDCSMVLERWKTGRKGDGCFPE